MTRDPNPRNPNESDPASRRLAFILGAIIILGSAALLVSAVLV